MQVETMCLLERNAFHKKNDTYEHIIVLSY